MARILYLLRKPASQIDPALFTQDGMSGTILLDAAIPQSMKEVGQGVLLQKPDGTTEPLSYADLVKQIFEYDRTIVI